MKRKGDLQEELLSLHEKIKTKDVVIKETLMLMKALVFKLGGKVNLKSEFLEAAKNNEFYVDLKYDEEGTLKLEIKKTLDLE